MDRRVIIVDESTTLTEAMGEMNDAQAWSLVVSREGRPFGVVTERDLIRRCFRPRHDPDVLTVGEIMSYPLVTIDRDLGVGAALNLLMTDEIRRLYVVDGDGDIIGRVTQTGCLRGTLNLVKGLYQVFDQR
ncbi:MAG TPA: CBS domain-containing protein [Candidatus Thalassarchaeaceae archaeon]|jgi:CBS domain-containing protein|nr:CBS domain-containing protein [Candidatus Thalassarchaeaceae archaeon]|tara:strand:+ start:21108 stop:21500 length:393 start_codon:yes stop_codon:yes gene_type:complete